MTYHRRARVMEAADRDAAFDWDKHNAEVERQLAELSETLDRWGRVERELSELHIDLARDLSEQIKGVL